MGKNQARSNVFDWNIFNTIRQQSNATSKSTSIVDSFKSLAEKLLQDEKNGQKASFAFMALSSENKNSDVENYVTDALTEAVFNTEKIRIIERANLEKILSEQKFQTSGLVNEDEAKAIGNIAGVDYVCYGSIKDNGETLTVSARVVDVETGEISAMSRATIQKDAYLKSHATASSQATASNAQMKPTTQGQTAPSKPAVKSQWIVRKSRNDFDECTVYTFMTPCSIGTKHFLYLGYEKYDNSMNSRIRAGQHWGDYKDSNQSGQYDWKEESVGKVSKLSFKDVRWSFDKGNYKVNYGDWFDFGSIDSLSGYQQITNMLLNNDYISVRKSGGTNGERFVTAGLESALAAEGITKEELMAAFESEKF